MNKEHIIKELNKLKDDISIITQRINCVIDEISQSENVQVVNKGFVYNTIKKFINQNGDLLNKDLQKKLSAKLWIANGKNTLTITSACKMCGIKYNYEGNSEWKDIKIIVQCSTRY